MRSLEIDFSEASAKRRTVQLNREQLGSRLRQKLARESRGLPLSGTCSGSSMALFWHIEYRPAPDRTFGPPRRALVVEASSDGRGHERTRCAHS